MQSEAIPSLQQIDPFSRLAPGVCQALQQRLRRVVISAKKHLVPQGEKGSFLALISKGQVELHSPTGKSLKLGPGQVFGVGVTYHGLPSADSVVTRTEVVLWVILGRDWQAARSAPVATNSPTVTKRFSSSVRKALLSLALAGLTLVILGAAPLQSTHTLVTRLALQAGRPDLAESYLRLAVYLQPEQSRIYDALGYAFYLQDKEDQALSAFAQAVALDADDATAQNNLGVVLLQQSQTAQAIAHLQKAIELHPGSSQALFNLANAYLATGDLEAASRQYRLASEQDPDHLQARAMLAGVLLNQGYLEEARQTWEQVLAADPGQGLALRGLGVVSVLEGRPESAVEYLQAALASRPDEALTRFYLGLALRELGKTAEADAQFGAALASSQDPVLSQLVKESLIGTLR